MTAQLIYNFQPYETTTPAYSPIVLTRTASFRASSLASDLVYSTVASDLVANTDSRYSSTCHVKVGIEEPPPPAWQQSRIQQLDPFAFV